jgi:hypothetical protein
VPEQQPPDDAPEHDAPTSDAPEHDAPANDEQWRRRRRLAEVFGDVLPDTTSDERDDAASSGVSEETAQERWLRSQVPPHHG